MIVPDPPDKLAGLQKMERRRVAGLPAGHDQTIATRAFVVKVRTLCRRIKTQVLGQKVVAGGPVPVHEPARIDDQAKKLGARHGVNERVKGQDFRRWVAVNLLYERGLVGPARVVAVGEQVTVEVVLGEGVPATDTDRNVVLARPVEKQLRVGTHGLRWAAAGAADLETFVEPDADFSIQLQQEIGVTAKPGHP